MLSAEDKFLLNFFGKAQSILEQKGGNKRKHSRKSRHKRKSRRGGGPKPVLPVRQFRPTQNNSLSVQSIVENNLREITQGHEQNTIVGQPVPIQSVDEATQFAEQIKTKLQRILSGDKTETLSAEDHQIMALFVNYKTLNANINAVAKEITTLNQEIQTEPEVEPEVATIIEQIEETTVRDLALITQPNTPPVTVFRTTANALLNTMGRISVLLQKLEEIRNNKVIAFVVKTISFLFTAAFNCFCFLMQFRIGRIFLLVLFANLYRKNNTVAVFVANLFLKLLRVSYQYATGVDPRDIDIKGYAQVAFNAFMDKLPSLMETGAGKAMLMSVFSTAVSSGAIAQFASHVTPEVSAEIIRQSVPAISNAVAETIVSSYPEMIQAITTTVASEVPLAIGTAITSELPGALTSAMTDLTPMIVDGVASGATEVMGQVAIDLTAKVAEQAVTSAAKGALTQKFTQVALDYTVPLIANYLMPGTGANLLTNSGGARFTRKVYKRLLW